MVRDGNLSFAIRLKGKNVVQFVYFIEIEGGDNLKKISRYVQVYCYLTPRMSEKDQHKPTVLEGSYTALAPDSLQGKVIFTRVENPVIKQSIPGTINTPG